MGVIRVLLVLVGWHGCAKVEERRSLIRGEGLHAVGQQIV